MLFSRWLRLLRTPRPVRSRAARRSFRPEVTPLEDRVAPAAGLVPGPTIDITQRAGTQNQLSITIDPTAPNRLFVISNNDVNGLVAHRSTDGGQTWTSVIIANGSDGLPVAVGDAQATFDDFGNLFITYRQVTAPGTSRINLLLSTDAGQSFTNIGGGGGLDTGTGVDRPAVATGPGLAAGQGSVWVAWRNASGVIAARGATVTGLGAVGAFGTTQTVPSIAGGDNVGNAVSIAVGPSGQVLVGYQRTFAGSDLGSGTLATSLDPDGLGSSGFLPPVTAAATNIGTNDNTPANQPIDPNEQIDASPHVVFDRSNTGTAGRAYLIGVDESPDESNNMSIVMVFSTDSGQTWQNIPFNGGRISDSTVNSRFAPALAVDPVTGYIAVTWYDARNDLGAGSSGDSDGIPNTEVQLWGAVSTDGGQTFTANVPISDGTTSSIRASSINGLGKYTSAAFFNNVLYPAWADNSTIILGNPQPNRLDIAVSIVPLGELGAEAGANFVARVYLDILGRSVDAGGLAFWTNFLAGGGSCETFVLTLLNSEEYQVKVIDQLYRQLLGRSVDPSGLAFGLRVLGNLPIYGGSRNLIEILRALILASDEYFIRNGASTGGFLIGLYRDVLGRPIESAALDLYGSLLNRGVSRQSIATTIVFSPEHLARLVQGAYNQFLRRGADLAGLGFFTGNLQRGSTDQEVILALVCSREYRLRFSQFGG